MKVKYKRGITPEGNCKAIEGKIIEFFKENQNLGNALGNRSIVTDPNMESVSRN